MSRYFWPILTPLPPVTLCHGSRIPRFLVGLVQKIRTKPLCTNSLSIVREGFCPGASVRGSFVWKVLSGVVFVHTPLSEYICYNRKLKITLNFMFHMYEKKIISVTSHALDPLPLSQTVTLSRTPSPLY